MNKLFTKIAAAFVGMAMAIGVGVAVAGNQEATKVNAAESEVSFSVSTTSDFGSNETAEGISGTFKTGSYTWNYTRTLTSGVAYTGSINNGYLQLGKNGGVDNFVFSTSNIPGTIKSVSIDCASYQGKHNVAITVGGNTYLSSTATPTWSSNKGATKTGTGTSSGEIIIEITNGTRAFYFKSITVVYEEDSSVSCTGIVADLTDTSKVWKKGQTVLGSDVTLYAEFSDGSDATITDGSGVTITNGTLAAGDNTVTVTYSGQTDTISVFGKAPTEIIYVTSSGTSTVELNAAGNLSVSDDLEFEVTYNTTPVSADYAATLACALSGWAKTADDGAGNLTLTFESNGTYNFTLTANDDGEVVENITYVISGIPTVEYELFSGSVEEGKYLITVDNYALKNTISSSRGDYAEISAVNSKVSTPAANIIWKLESSGSYFTIYNESANKYFASTGVANKAQLLTDGSDEKALWTIEESSTGVYHFTNNYNADHSVNAKLQKNGTYGFACYSSFSDITLYKLPEAPKTIESTRMVAGTVSASSGNTKWTLNGFKFFVTYEGEEEVEVTSNTSFNVAEDVPTINTDGSMNVTVTPVYKGVTYSEKAQVVSATLTFVNLYSIERLYTLGADLGKSETYGDVEFDGIFMGYVADRGVFVMNGDYGILIFHAENSNTYVVGETYLTISGSLCTYNHLYEIAEGATVSVLTNETRKANVQTPRTYVVDGSEDATTRYLANRKTSLSGVVSKIGNSTTAGTKATASSNNSIYVTVGGKDVLLYLTQTNATTEVCNKIEVGKSLTCEGFSIYFNLSNVATFEVLFSNLVEASNYHAADFAKDLLKMTKGTCNSSYDGIVSNGETLAGYWLTLSGSDYWLKVEAAGEEDALINGTPDSTIVVPEGATESETNTLIDAMSDEDAIAAALYRYDYCTAKYSLTNFIDRKLTVSFSNSRLALAGAVENSVAATIIVIVSMISITAIGGYFFIRKRKEQ